MYENCDQNFTSILLTGYVVHVFGIFFRVGAEIKKILENAIQMRFIENYGFSSPEIKLQ